MSSFLIKLQQRIYRNRSITFTPAGTRFVFLTLAIGVAAVNTGNNLLYLILGMMLSLIIVSGILSEQSLRKISVEWRFPTRIFAQQPVPVEVRISNGKRFLPSFSFRVDAGTDPPQSVYTFKLSAHQSTAFPQTTRFEKRGWQTLPALRFHTTFPFGFFHKSLIRPHLRTVLVYPRVLPVPPRIEWMSSRPGQDHEYRQRGSGATLHNLRDYTPLDDARGIHWKASARESKLLLKEYEREEDDNVHLFFNNRLAARSEEQLQNFERAVELTASLAYAFSHRGFAVTLRTLSQSEAGAETSPELDAVLKKLALIQPVYDSADPTEQDRVNQSIAALGRAVTLEGRRILILSSPDSVWDRQRGRYSEVLVASEPRFKVWSQTGGRRR
ncbi:MAG TPA: DUF58 domain-containing protein [Nitrospiria bacterium]|nr:DUF58 domain-containing protein [Nitrospiria bacterium]